MHLTQKLILEQPTEADLSRFFEIYSDPQTNLFNPVGPMTAAAASESFIAIIGHWLKHKFGIWAVREDKYGTVIGFGGLSYRLYGNELKLNLGYRFDKSAWGKGYATELAAFAITYGFDELGADVIYALVRPAHGASIRVLEKVEMQLTGELDDVPGQAASLVYTIHKN